MKTFVLFLSLVLSLNIYAQSIEGSWELVKLTLENQEYNRPINEEASTLNGNFYYESDGTWWTIYCTGYTSDPAELNEQESILLINGLITLAFPQDCDLDVNNVFDDLNHYFWSNREDYEGRDWYIDPLQFEYEINGEGNNVELIFTNEHGDKAYYSVASASTNVFDETDVNIYPNPAQSTININLPNADYQNITIQIFDISGKKIKSYTKSWQENIELDIKDLPSGNYVLELNATDYQSNKHTLPFIKQ